MTEEGRIYKLIEDERKERITSIDGIHSRLDDLFSLINKMNKVSSANGNGNQASWVRQSIGLTIAVISIIGIMSGIVVGAITPINQNIQYIQSDLRAYKIDNQRGLEQFMRLYDETHAVTQERVGARFVKLEEWQRWWYRQIPERDSKQEAEIKELRRQIADMKIFVIEKASDRFTGAEGSMMQKQIDRLEDRLTVLTKQSLKAE